MTYQWDFPRVDQEEVTVFTMDICQSTHQGWVKTLGNVMCQWTSEETRMCSRGNDINAHWCQQIVNPKIDMATHQTGSQLARPNKEGVVKWVSTPLCQEEGWACIYLPDAEYSCPHKGGPLPPIQGWLHTLHWRQWNTKSMKKPEPTARAWGCACQKAGGGWITPRYHPGHWLE